MAEEPPLGPGVLTDLEDGLKRKHPTEKIMNKELAEMYGNDTESVEKLAAAELAEKLSDEGGIDLKSLTEEQLEELAKSVMSQSEETVEETEEEPEAVEETPAEEPAAEPEKTAEATTETASEELTDEDKQKLAEADYLGRVMAHAFVAEKRDIEKTAGKFGDAAGKVGAKLKELGAKAKGKIGANPKKSMAAGGAAAAGAGFAAGRASKKEKKGSATPNLDALADARVKEILEANGIKEEPVAEPEKPVEAEKTAEPSAEEKEIALAGAVETRAIEKLKALGYEVTAEEKPEETPVQE